MTPNNGVSLRLTLARFIGCISGGKGFVAGVEGYGVGEALLNVIAIGGVKYLRVGISDSLRNRNRVRRCVGGSCG